jgi:perosamine synthetase
MRQTRPGGAPPRRAPSEYRFVPSLPTLEPRLLMPGIEPPRAQPFPFVAPGAQSFYLARAGVCHAVRELGGRGGVVLMPAYHHGVEVEAVRAAGAEVVFYRVDGAMQADPDDVRHKLRAHDVRILYVTHFVGFAQPTDVLTGLAAAHGARVIEDCALALLSRDTAGRPLGALGDASVFCLYKTLPVPHGGLLVAPRLPRAHTSRPPLASTLHHAAGLVLAHLELRGGALGRALRGAARALAHASVDRVVENVQTGTMHLEPRELALGASRVVERLVTRFDLEMVAVRRRRNFRRLAAALDGVVPVVGAPLAPGACPLFVPVLVDDKRATLAALHAGGIDAVDFWSTGDPRATETEFPEVAALRRHVLELPCHQSLDDDDVDYVARAVKHIVAHA